MRSLLLSGAATLLWGAVAAGAEPEPTFKVIVHQDNPIVSLTRAELSTLFLRRRLRWPDDVTAYPVDQSGHSAVRVAFTREVHGRRVVAIESYWLQVLFSGRGVPPPQRSDDRDVIEYVRANRGAVGYILASARAGSVKVLQVKP
jgi:hypothetical protein